MAKLTLKISSADFFYGRMKNTEKNNVMDASNPSGIDVLVSTTVIEVGVDVPNATIMIIQNAERFWLAQLHQLRGRGW
ncbi:MAG: helicase-related protein [Caldisericia bacterium]